jgi:hypothetical protein
MEVRQIIYFDKPERSNTDKILEFASKRIEDLGIHHAVLAWSSGYTVRKFLEMTRNTKIRLGIVAVTNARGAKMPIVVRPVDDEETRKWKEEQLKKGITGTPISISDETRQDLEKQGVKVYYVPDYLNFGEPLALREEQALLRSKLAPFGIPEHLRPLDIDAGANLSILTAISQGFRVCIGCTVVAVKNGFIPEGEIVLSVGGMATALVLQAGSNTKTCLVKEIISLERSSA